MSETLHRQKFNRALVKLSGEALAGNQGFGLDAATLSYIAAEVAECHRAGFEIGIVVGGGNFVRGEVFSSAGGIDRTAADQMGMLGTLINALALQAAIERQGIQVRVQSAIAAAAVAEPFIVRRAVRHLEKKRVVIFAAGTGNPYFTTDTAAVLRALEIQAGVLVKATKVDGVYTADPRKDPTATKYDTVDYTTAITERLGVMDQTAFTMARENRLPLIVLDFNQSGSLLDALKGGTTGTLVGGE